MFYLKGRDRRKGGKKGREQGLCANVLQEEFLRVLLSGPMENELGHKKYLCHIIIPKHMPATFFLFINYNPNLITPHKKKEEDEE
jgi:hypothetical protein